MRVAVNKSSANDPGRSDRTSQAKAPMPLEAPSAAMLYAAPSANLLAVQRLIEDRPTSGPSAAKAFQNAPQPPVHPRSDGGGIGALQRKPTIISPGDALEREADVVAEKVMRMAEPPAIGSAPIEIQRKCAQCKDEHEKIFTKSASPESGAAALDTASAVRATEHGGAPLPRSVRDYFEPRFGRDFGTVRVHADAKAASAARGVQARAYTLGRDIVFGAGEYAPSTGTGMQLLAHELTHVIQQEGNGSEVISRKECSATRACSPPDRCSQPDAGEEGTTAPSTWWMLTVNVDIEKDSWEGALRSSKLGHTHVRFSESNGKQYTYGFYPAGAIPNENTRSVEGCVNHPDTSHDSCTDIARSFPLTQAQYTAALNYAQGECRGRHYYGLSSTNVSYTCTTFAADVARAAGKQLPNTASAPTTVFYQAVPSIDNPNTLHESLNASNQGIGSDERSVLSIIEMGGPNLLIRYPWQEKARWISVLLNETWITDRDVAAIERVCRVGMAAADLPKVKSAVTPLLGNMNSSRQRTRVQNALDGL